MKKTTIINQEKVSAFRAAFTAVAESGNRRKMTQKMFIEHGGTPEWWAEYEIAADQAETWGRKMCQYMFNVAADDLAELEKRETFIEECNKKLLSIERRMFTLFMTPETRHCWHVTSKDGAYIAFLTDEFAAKENVERGKTINRVHAPVTHNVFRKRLETHLGTKLLEEDVMSGDRHEFLRNERKLMSTISRANSEREELKKQLTQLEVEQADPANEGAKAYIQGKINNIKSEMAKYAKTAKGAQDKLNKLRKEHPAGEMHEQSTAEVRETAESVEGKQKAEAEQKELIRLRRKPVSKLTKDELIRELTISEGEFDDTGLNKAELKELVRDARALDESEAEPEKATA